MSRENEPPTPVDDMSRDQLLALVRETQQKASEESQRANQAEKRVRLADTTNRPRGRPRKRARRIVDSDDEDDANENSDGEGEGDQEEEGDNDDEKKVWLAAHKYVMTQGLWFVQSPKKVLGAIENTSYNEKNRFDNMRTKVQGELRAVLEVLPEELHGDVGKSWLSVQFNKAMDRQRSNTSSRLRNDIGAVFVTHLHPRVGDALDIQDMALRAGYADLIGGRKDDSGKITFHPFDAPALHSDGADRLNVETFLKNKLVMHVAAAVIYGKKKPIKMATNKPCVSGPRCMQQMHNISNSTPGFVACAGALTLWALSMDVELKKKGQQTGINWYSCYESYLRYLLEGLRNRSKPVLALFREWDAELFPDSEMSLGDVRVTNGAAGGDELDAALDAIRNAEVEEEEDVDMDNAGDGETGNDEESGDDQ
ncbi:hypothetical protein R3P38DRAFT_2622167 [Favolaschia claudopus]|uniref:Uncharacterized protein n=1 Tax=Favolaschia claudopus TaxID=2862362 RepID=A0AAW0BQM0_9AGAR